MHPLAVSGAQTQNAGIAKLNDNASDRGKVSTPDSNLENKSFDSALYDMVGPASGPSSVTSALSGMSSNNTSNTSSVSAVSSQNQAWARVYLTFNARPIYSSGDKKFSTPSPLDKYYKNELF